MALVVFCLLASTGRLRAGEDDDARLMLFSGRDIWRHGLFSYEGLLVAPAGFDQDGLLLKILTGGGVYGYHANAIGSDVLGVEWLAQLLPGWRIKRGEAEFKFFMGPELQGHYLFPDDLSNRLRGELRGLRIAAELWYEPSSTSMVAADLSLSSIAASNSARAAYGWRVLEEALGGVYIGPEAQYFGSGDYRHFRLGAHITSLKTSEYEWSAGIGFARDSDRRSGPYVRLSILQRR
ncbi:MAG TPA: cellulose biosynthesis protein BcsS [Pseudolabrys sp.]|nr:cellulose biosynthesis protein BcsS [Pseudolabrys sp.]